MTEEKIEALDIYWWVTYGANDSDFPREVEIQLLKKYHEEFGKLPRWNNEF